MKKLFTLAMMLVGFSTISVAQVNFALNTTNIDTFDAERWYNHFSVLIEPDSGWLINSGRFELYSTVTSYSGLGEFRTLDQNTVYVAGSGVIQANWPRLSAFGGSINSTMPFNCNVSAYLCPTITGTFTDYIYLNLEIGVQGMSSWITVDTTFAVPIVHKFDSLPELNYNTATGMLAMTAGDWRYRYEDSMTGIRSGAWLVVRDSLYGQNDYIFKHFIRDTIVDVWHVMDSLGHTDSCYTAFLYTGEEWCLWSETRICRPLSVDTYSVIVPRIVAFPNPTKGMVRVHDLANGVITVTNIQGQRLSPPINGNEVDLGEFPSGIYLISIHTPSGGWVATLKVARE